MMNLPWTIRQRLIMLVAVFAIPMMLLIVGAVAYFAHLTRENQYKGLEFAARSMAQAVDAQLSQYIVLAKSLAQSPALLDDDLSAFRGEAARAFPDFAKAWVVVSNTDYQQLLNLYAPPGAKLPKLGDKSRSAQDRAFATGLPQISHVRKGVVSGAWVATVEVPIFVNGKPFRCLTITMDLREFSKLLSEKELPQGWIAGIADGQGRFVARVPANDTMVGQPISTSWRAILRQEGIAETKTLEGDLAVNANVNSKLSDWTVGLGAKKSVIEAPAWHTIQWAILLGTGTSALCIMLAAWVARGIINPVETLGASASALVSGAPPNYSATLPEAAQLWKTLVTAVSEREKSQAEARAQSREIQTLYESSPIGLAVLDLAALFVRVNKALAAITGQPAGLHLGRRMCDLVPSVAGAVSNHVNEVLRTGASILDVEMILHPEDRSSRRFWIASFYPLKANDGTAAAVGMTLRDVTAEREATEKVKLLMDEVNHRSKNLLAVVQSVAYHTAKDGDPAIFAKRLMDRIAGLAKSQDLLVDNNWRDVDLRQLLERQLIHFKDSFGDRIQFNGPAVDLNAAATQTLGMAFNELATNAAKYGALSDERGLIRVEWGMKVNGAGPKLWMRWTEANGPAVAPPTRKGFGYTVMVRMVEQSLEADVQLLYDRSGVIWAMTAPATEVLSRPDPISDGSPVKGETRPPTVQSLK